MRRRDQWIEWIREVERESETAAYAIELLQDQLRRDPSSLDYRGLGYSDFFGMRENREATYLLRLFAVFETDTPVRSLFGTKISPRMPSLILTGAD